MFNGIPIEGFAEDDCIDIEFDSEGYQDQVGADGRVVRYKSADQRATITFSIMATSPSNKLLSAMYNADLKSPSGMGVGPEEPTHIFSGVHMRQNSPLPLAGEARVRVEARESPRHSHFFALFYWRNPPKRRSLRNG